MIPSFRCGVAALALAALAVTSAAAQSNMVVTIDPASGSWSGTTATHEVDVTIHWCSASATLGTPLVLLDGDPVELALAPLYQAGCTAYGRSTGKVALTPGTHLLEASADDGYAMAMYSYSGPPPEVSVTPEATPVAVAGGSLQVARFRVENTGVVPFTYGLGASCTNVSSCSVSGSTFGSLEAGEGVYADVVYGAPVSGTAQVRLTATTGGAEGQGTVNVSALAAASAGHPGDSASLLRIERNACFIVSLAPSAASECGDLRVVHSLPGVRVLNQVRAPVLLYSHEHALPRPIFAEHVTPPAGTHPDSIHALLTVNGVTYTGRWAGWSSSQTRRVAVSFNATSLGTGVHPYTLQVVFRWNNGSSQALPPRSGQMVVVGRTASPFGPGWWLAGVEQLHHVAGDTLKLWVGGDGSARIYRGTSAAGPWVAESFDRPDTLMRRDSAGAVRYVRTLPGRAEVRFDNLGDHVATVSRLGHVTTFTWQSFATGKRRLTAITLPSAPGAPETLTYTFEYQNNATSAVPRLSRVVAPAPVGTRATVVGTDANGRITSITDPGSNPVHFGYSGNSNLIVARTDRRGSTATFTYTRQKVQLVTRVVGADTLRTTVVAPQGMGLNGASFNVDSVWVSHNGPRPGTADVVRWTVDRWGAPTRMRVEFLGAVTQVTRGDPRWPGRVTQVVAPNGFTTTASYDARGNLASQTEWNPYGDGRHATTTYRWQTVQDPVWSRSWDELRQVTAPEGEITLMQYDSVGRRLWEQVGPDSVRRVRYQYHPKSHTTAPGLVERVVLPGGGFERYEYDTRGNLSATVSAMGSRSEFVSDRIGRVTLSLTAIDTVAGVLRFQGDSTTHFDARDRPLRAVSFGPPMNGVGAQSIVVQNEYDEEGNILSVSRVSVPDSLGIGAVTTRWIYDDIGRPIVEVAPDATPGNLSDNPRDSTVYDMAGNVVEVHTRRWDDAISRVVVYMDYDAIGRLTHRRTNPVQYHARNQGIAQREFIKAWEPEVYSNGVPPYPWYPNDGSTGYRIAGDTARFAYDGSGNLLRADNRDAWVRRSYYPNGAMRGDTLKIRTLAELSAGGDSTSHVYGLLHTYDRNGRRTRLQHPATVAPRVAGVLKDLTTWSYDPLTGALATVVDPLGNAFRYHHDVRGQVDSLHYPGGISDAFQFDLDGRLVRHRTLNSNASGADRYTVQVLRDETFRYDARGKMTFSGNTALARDTSTVRYTGLGHILEDTVKSKGATVNGAIPASTMTQVVAHDALGNRGAAVTGSTFRIGGYFESQSSAATQRYLFGTGRQRAYQDNFRIDTLYYDGGGNQVFSTTSATAITGSELRDAAYFYGADGRLAAADVRNIADDTNVFSYYTRVFEEYRYDALGRRVLVRLRRDCAQTQQSALCEMGFVRRVVWDGDRELYEIQAWGGWAGQEGSWVEADTARPRPLVVTQGLVDPNPFLGRVAYTYGSGLDQPLGVVRMGYTSRLDSSGQTSTLRDFEPVAIVPFWNSRGQAGLGAFADGTWRKCMPDAHCMNLAWPEMWAGYARPKWARSFWHGTLLEDKADASGLNYRRNRYYDPVNGRFTQEDPIGLAGGLNLYGFAAGDPVNFGDPYGLRPLTQRERRRLGDFCEEIDCDRVQIFDGRGTPSENRLRDGVLRASGGRSFTMGYNIYLSDRDIGNMEILAHEVFHVWQFATWGRGRYLRQGVGARIEELRGRNPYHIPNLGESVLGFHEYGMEQQAQLVERCFRGDMDSCVLSPFQPRTLRVRRSAPNRPN
jgi:RHS repeat-associated protein